MDRNLIVMIIDRNVGFVGKGVFRVKPPNLQESEWKVLVRAGVLEDI